jgi:hypothetical protein
MVTFSSRWVSVGVLGLVALVVAASGCGGTKKVTVNGTVSYKGQPVSGGMLQFVGPKGGAPSAASIQQNGTFIITDVLPGEVRVGITPTPQSSGPSGDKKAPRPKVTADDLPEKFRDPEKSGLKYTITPETKHLDIKITD